MNLIWSEENPPPNWKNVFLARVFQIKISIEIFLYFNSKTLYRYFFNFFIVVSQGLRVNLDPWHQDSEDKTYYITIIFNRSSTFVDNELTITPSGVLISFQIMCHIKIFSHVHVHVFSNLKFKVGVGKKTWPGLCYVFCERLSLKSLTLH